MVNFSDRWHSYTRFEKVNKHGINMSTLESVSHLSWKAIRDRYSEKEFEEKLSEIENSHRNYTPLAVAIGGGLACGGFCVQFGCDWTAFFYAAISAFAGLRLKQLLERKGWNVYLTVGFVTFVATLIAWLTSFVSLSPVLSSVLPSFMISDTPWHPLMASALFVVPGVPLINVVSDMFDGHVQIGMARAVHTLCVIVAMVFGIALAIKCCGIDNFVKDLNMTPHNSYIAYMVAAAISAVGFSMIFNVPVRLLKVVAIGGAIAVCIRNFVNLGPSTNNIGLDMGIEIGSLVGSTVVSIIAVWAMHRFHTPHHCISIPCVIPMIPGVLMYRSLFGFITMSGVIGELTFAMYHAVLASLVILFMAFGVAIPNVFFRQINSQNRKNRFLRVIVERKNELGENVDLNRISHHDKE